MVLFGMEFNLATAVVFAIVAGLAYLAAHRLWKNGMCDCHADDPRGHKGGCAGCNGCSAAARMAADMQAAVEGR